MLLGGELQIDAKIFNFEIFESALYMKSGSMPLNVKLLIYQLAIKLQLKSKKAALL